MLHLAPEREGWKPKIVRTVATENKGVDELAAAIAEYREHFGESAERQEQKDRALESAGFSRSPAKLF